MYTKRLAVDDLKFPWDATCGTGAEHLRLRGSCSQIHYSTLSTPMRFHTSVDIRLSAIWVNPGGTDGRYVLTVEAIHLCDLPTLVVPAEESHLVRVSARTLTHSTIGAGEIKDALCLKGEQQGHGLETVMSTVDKVTL